MQTRHPFGGLADDSGISDFGSLYTDDGNPFATRRRSRTKRKRASIGRSSARKHRRRSRGLFGIRRRRRSGRVRRRSGRRSSGKIYKTKNGQPYKIMPNGRARFIKRR